MIKRMGGALFLGACLAWVAPNELPTKHNGWSPYKAAAAADFTGRIKRVRIKKRRVGTYRAVMVVQNPPGSTIAAERAELLSTPMDGSEPTTVPLAPSQVVANYRLNDPVETTTVTIDLQITYQDAGSQAVVDDSDGFTASVTLEKGAASGETDLGGIRVKAIRSESGAVRLAFSGASDVMQGFSELAPAKVLATVTPEAGKAQLVATTYKQQSVTWQSDWAEPISGDECVLTVNICHLRIFDGNGNLLVESEVAENDLVIAPPAPGIVKANIRRNKLKQRNNGLFRSMMTSGSDGSEEFTATVAEVSLSLLDDDGTVTETAISKTDSPYSVRLSGTVSGYPVGSWMALEWKSPVFGSVFVDAPVLPVAELRDADQQPVILCDGEQVDARVKGCQPLTIAVVDRSGDGSRVSVNLSGRPGAFGGDVVTSSLYGEILISGDPIEFDEDRVWVVEPPVALSGEDDGRTYRQTSTTFNAFGETLAVHAVEGQVGSEEVRAPASLPVIGDVQLQVNGNGRLTASVVADLVFEEPFEGPEPDELPYDWKASVYDNTTGTHLLTVKDTPARGREAYARWENLQAIEPDNVVDMTYDVTFDIYAPGGSYQEAVTLTLDAQEIATGQEAVVTFAEGAIAASLTMNDDGETFTLQARAANTAGQPSRFVGSPGYAFLISRLEPENGGSEFELDTLVLSQAGERLRFDAVGEPLKPGQTIDAARVSISLSDLDGVASVLNAGLTQWVVTERAVTLNRGKGIVADTPFLSMEDLED